MTKAFPTVELYRLTNQMCRSASSAATNIVEGSKKESKKERARFYETSLCSLEELHYQCQLSYDLEYIKVEQFEKAEDQIRRTSFLVSKLRQSCFKEASTTSTTSATSTT